MVIQSRVIHLLIAFLKGENFLFHLTKTIQEALLLDSRFVLSKIQIQVKFL